MDEADEKTGEVFLELSNEEAESIVAIALQKNNVSRRLLPQPFYEQMVTGVKDMFLALQAKGWKIQRPSIESSPTE